MATPDDTTFGADFDQAEFESAILSTMQMGMPSTETEGLTWHWERDRTWTEQSPGGNPYSWTDTPETDEPGNPEEDDGSVQVPYAIEWSGRPAASKDTELGQFDASRAVIYLLADGYEQVKTADYAQIHGDRYEIDLDAPPLGLFDSTIYTIILTAEDES